VKKRIIGIDVARAFAVIGMIIVNFTIVFGGEGDGVLKLFTGFLEGKAAATFVVLAGVGIALMSNSAISNADSVKINVVKTRLAKKAIFLFVVGLSYTPLWIADILHFYGIYMIITVLLIKSSQRMIAGAALGLILIYPLLMLIWNYETAWNFETFEYFNFWTINGFLRNLFYNGFHPVIPWVAFMLIGLWYGRQDLNDNTFIKKSMYVSMGVFIATLIVSKLMIVLLSSGDHTVAAELKQILGTSPMPPLPVYMIAGSSFAIFAISCCVFIAQRFERNFIIIALNRTGKLALTFYVAHVIIGMGVIEAVSSVGLGNYSIEFSVIYAFVFSILCIIFASIWLQYFKAGPLEWIMRKLTD